MPDSARFGMFVAKAVDVMGALELLPAPLVHAIATRWHGRPFKGNKTDALRTVVQGLDTPSKLSSFIQELPETVRAGLGILKAHGGELSSTELALEILTLGYPVKPAVPDPYGYLNPYGYDYSYGGEPAYPVLQDMLETGLVAQALDYPRYSTPPAYTDEGAAYVTILDQRAVKHIRPLPPRPLELHLAAGTPSGVRKSPAEMTMRLVALLDALRRLGTWELTQKGRAPKTVVTKLDKLLKWNKQATESFREPTFFYFQLVQALGLVEADSDFVAGLAPDAESVFELPLPVQGRLLANAYQALTGWTEWSFPRSWVPAESLYKIGSYNALRAMLCTGLGALPDPSGWYRVQDFAAALEARVGDHFSFLARAPFYPPYGKNADVEKAREAWRASARSNWLANEGRWVRIALEGPLQKLGMVEMGQASDPADACFRLTDLGHDALYNRLRPNAADRLRHAGGEEAGDAWIVQPNGDIVVYLDRASARQLAFLGRIAERGSTTGNVATYRLLRESVYSGLERGLEIAEIRERLQRGSSTPLASGLVRNLEDWAARREKLTVYPLAEVLQYPDRAARDRALEHKEVTGEPVGEVFVRLTAPLKKSLASKAAAIDYREPPPRCLEVTETGEITLRADLADFFAHSELENWAEPAGARDLWRVTRASVERAVLAGWDADRILQRLESRAVVPVPSLLATSIRNWARKRTVVSAALARQLVLQLSSEDAATAVWNSAVFKGCFKERLGPRTFLVAEEQAETLRTALEAHGFWVADDLSLAARRL